MKNPFARLFHRVKPRTCSTCGKPLAEGNLNVTVLGHEMTFTDPPSCPSCATAYLNKHSTICGVCEKPIIPGEAVAVAINGSRYLYTHLTFQCCPSVGLWCGSWGESRLKTLHEVDPEHFSENTELTIEHTTSNP